MLSNVVRDQEATKIVIELCLSCYMQTIGITRGPRQITRRYRLQLGGIMMINHVKRLDRPAMPNPALEAAADMQIPLMLMLMLMLVRDMLVPDDA